MTDKPPIGVQPEYLYERERIMELTRAISDHVDICLQGDYLPRWADELKKRIDRFVRLPK
jgi:hypothetical protein